MEAQRFFLVLVALLSPLQNHGFHHTCSIGYRDSPGLLSGRRGDLDGGFRIHIHSRGEHDGREVQTDLELPKRGRPQVLVSAL